MSEKTRLEALWLKHPCTFRNDVRMGYSGGREFRAKQDGVIAVKKGDLIVINPFIKEYGLQSGSGDLVGWTEPGAIFTSIEDKSAKDRISYDQIIWLLNVRIAGGIALVYREGIELSLDEILELPRRQDKRAADKEKMIGRLLGRLDK
jgi:hypothetical protein